MVLQNRGCHDIEVTLYTGVKKFDTDFEFNTEVELMVYHCKNQRLTMTKMKLEWRTKSRHAMTKVEIFL